jgi:hypothetical protein
MDHRALFAGIILSVSGCIVPARNVALERASAELTCPIDQLVFQPRPDVFSGVIDMRGCGRVARYFCFRAPQSRSAMCTREPNPDPAEEQARAAAQQARAESRQPAPAKS